MATAEAKNATQNISGTTSDNTLNREITTRYARYGAEQRLRELEAEQDEIIAAFPEIQRERQRAKLALNAERARAAIGKRRGGRPKGSKNRVHDTNEGDTQSATQ